MDLAQIFQDKTLKTKAKVAAIGESLLIKKLSTDTLIAFAQKQKASEKATCIEALEYATKKQADIADKQVLVFVAKALEDSEPRVKWESAKVIGNIAKLFKKNLNKPIENLIPNAEYSGTVVRWATAYALAEILKLKTPHNEILLPKIQELSETEEDNSVQKKYLDALKKLK